MDGDLGSAASVSRACYAGKMTDSETPAAPEPMPEPPTRTVLIDRLGLIWQRQMAGYWWVMGVERDRTWGEIQVNGPFREMIPEDRCARITETSPGRFDLVDPLGNACGTYYSRGAAEQAGYTLDPEPTVTITVPVSVATGMVDYWIHDVGTRASSTDVARAFSEALGEVEAEAQDGT